MTKTNELVATLEVVRARIDAGPKDAIDWQRIADLLGEAKAYAVKCADLRSQLEKVRATNG